MRGTFFTLLIAGGSLALGGWTTPGQSGQVAPPEPAQASTQQTSDLCAPVQATANAHRRGSHARDEGIRRTHTRPRAALGRASVDADCPQSWSMVRRDAHRARRNAAIDRSLNRGE
jgi:hypothetical protein